jgi:cutinase-like protein
VFGNPSAKLGLPLTMSPVWGGRSIDLCNGGDPICQTDGQSVAAHRPPGYTGGMVSSAADFVAGRV